MTAYIYNNHKKIERFLNSNKINQKQLSFTDEDKLKSFSFRQKAELILSKVKTSKVSSAST